MASPVDKAMELFLANIENQQKKEQHKADISDKVIQEKHMKLVPIRQLLKKLMDMDLWVHNTDCFTGTAVAKTLDPQKFQVYENDSSPSWSPGISLFFDHPAQVEIAIPNRLEEGVIILRCASRHPDAILLNKSFYSIDDACIALSTFLAKNAVRVGRANSSDSDTLY